MSTAEIGVIALALLPFVLSPGGSFGLTMSGVLMGPRRAPWLVAAGTGAGIATIAIGSRLLAVDRIVASVEWLPRAMSLVGGGVLVAMGLGVLLGLRNPGQERPQRMGRLVTQAYLAVVTSPKALALYLFVAPGFGPVVFPGVHIALTTMWLALVGLVIERIPGLGRSPRWRMALIAISGLGFIAVGAGMWLQVPPAIPV